MKYFVIYSDQNPQGLENFNKNNQHLAIINADPIQTTVSSQNLREELLKDKIIEPSNVYDSTNLAITKTHISLWQHAVETQSAITVFEANVVTHKDFLQHQKTSLTAQPHYDLIIWGYNLNWNPCVELMPCLPKVIYTFPGYSLEEFKKENNDTIDIPTYQNNDLESVHTLKTFSFASLGCYTISAKGAEYLLEKTRLIGNTPAPSYQDKPFGTNFYVFHPIPQRENISFDIEVNRHIKQLNAYMAFPMLAVIPTNTNI